MEKATVVEYENHYLFIEEKPEGRPDNYMRKIIIVDKKNLDVVNFHRDEFITIGLSKEKSGKVLEMLRGKKE